MPRKDLPSPNASNFLARVREEIHSFMGRVGDGIDRALTLREMIASGLLTQGSGGGLAPGPATEYEVDLTPPPPPSNLQATTSGNSILVTINPQTYRQGNGPGTVTIYGAKYMAGDALPVFADAAVLDEFPGDVHSFPVDPGALYRIWAKSVSRDGVPSEPVGGTNGVEPVPGLLDDVSIASLTASRIRSGSVTVGQFIQAAGYVPATAGWRINGDGTAEFSQVVVRGTIFASQGAIGGWNIGSNYLQSTTYVLGESGTRLNSDGTGQIGGITVYAQGLGAGSTAYNTGNGAWLGRDGKLSLRNVSGSSLTFDGSRLKAQSADASRLLDLGATGLESVLKVGTALDIKADGSATFAGSLNAASGTFSGVLTADAISAVSTINIAGNAVTTQASASGDGSCATTITIPPNAVGSIIAICTKDYAADVAATDATFTLSINGDSRSVLIRYGFYSSGGSGGGSTTFYYRPMATMIHIVQGYGPGTYVVSASMDIGRVDALRLAVFSSWR